MAKKSVIGAAMALTLLTSSAQAVRCDYCPSGGEGEWNCKPSYVGYPDTGEYYFAGSVCTYFYATPTGGQTPSSQYADIWDVIRDRFFYRADMKVPNSTVPHPDKAATCTSDVGARFDHAHQDVADYFVVLTALQQPKPAPGNRVQVKYDDGGTELWRVVDPNSASAKIFIAPEEGTLKCPTTYQ